MPRSTATSRWHGALLACAAAAFACIQDFPSQPDLTVTLSPAAPWPQLLSVTDVDTLEVAITGGDGDLVTGLEVEWQSSRPAVIEVAALSPAPGATRADSLAALLRAIVTARASDTATVAVRVVQGGFAPAELRLLVRVEPLRLTVSGGSLGAGLTVTDSAITGLTITNARNDTLSGLTVSWRSSDPAALQVSTISQAGPDSGKAQSIARRSGVAEVIATVAPAGFAPVELRSPVTIERLLVQPVGMPVPAMLRVTEEQIIAVAVRSSSGQPRANRPVTWISSDPSVLQVTGVRAARDTAFARLTAFRQGSAWITATVAPPAFEASEFQDTVAVDSIDVQPATTWPDSLTVTQDDTVGVQTSNAPGAIVTWRSSDPAVLGVAGNVNGQPDRAVLTGRGRGAADVLVTVERTGYQASVLRRRIGVDTIRLARLDGALRDTVTVLDTVRTRVALLGVHSAAINATWTTSDPAVLRVAVVPAGDPDSGKVQVIALQRGSASVTASVVGPSSFTPVVLQVPVRVVGLVLQPTVPFPARLTVTDSQIVSLLPRDSRGQPRPGVVTAWSSSDPAILQVRALGAAADTARAMLTALQLGSAQVVAAIAPAGFEASELRGSVTMDSISVTLGTGTVWPDNLTVTEDSTVVLRLTGNAGTVATAAVSVTWRSSDPNVLGVVGDAGQPLRAVLTANRHGVADVVAEVSRGGFLISTFSRRVTVDSLVVDQVPGAALPSGLTVTDDVLARVRVRRNATGGSLIAGLPVAWSSSNPAVLQVVNSGTDTARVTALRAGTADVIATVDPTGTEPVQFRSTIAITGLTVTQDSTRLWPDTMAATDDSVLAIQVTGAAGLVTRALPVRWQIGNGTSQTLSGRSALLHAGAPGWAVVTVVVGQAPYDTTFYRDSVRVMQRWIAVSTGGGQTCGVTVDSAAYCWGLYRGAGDGRVSGSATPTRVVSPFGDPKFYRISVSTGFDEGSACGVVRGGILYCWGSNGRYQLGNSTAIDQLLAGPALSVGAVLDVAAGLEATCGVMVDSTAMCWGLQDYNQTGDVFQSGAVPCAAFGMTGTTCLPPRLVGRFLLWPVPQGGFTSISVGSHHACGVTSARVGWCWGLDDFGQTGADTSIFAWLNPITCTVTSSAGSLAHQCRLPAPVGRAGGSPPLQFRFVSAGGDANSMTLVPNNRHLGGRGFSCGVTTGDEVYCWGLNDQGALGATSSGTCPFYPYGSAATTALNLPCSLTPVLVGGGYVAVATGARHACALTTSGLAWCWGGNNTNQLGTTTAQQCSTYQWQFSTAVVLVPCSTQPVAVAGGHRFTTLSAGGHNTCGLATTGAIYCWGNNQSGQLGDLTQLARPTPVRVAEPQ